MKEMSETGAVIILVFIKFQQFHTQVWKTISAEVCVYNYG